MCASRVPHLGLPAACAGLPQAVRGVGAAAAFAGPGAGGSMSPLMSRSPAPSVSHASHTKLHRLREQACGHAPHEPGACGPHRAWSSCRPCGHSPRAVRVVASGADAVLGRQEGESHGSIENRLCQMEAQLEEKNKELQRVPVLTGRRCLGRRHGLGGGQRCLSPLLPSLPPSVCMCGPIC